ncbi:MAG TPA: sialidase family protein, partial [Bacteroidales bacterium]|nr:sialidase family protein [Bacteroidales bacterium]
MKKFLLLSMVFCIGIEGFSQKATSVSKDLLKKSAEASIIMNTDDATNFNNPVNMMTNTDAFAPTETIIGTTQYDLFSNSFIGNRFYRWEDGAMAAVWIFGQEATAFPDRGTGYNFYDGTTWGPQPTARVENTRTGWPNIDDWGAGEVGVAHNGSAGLEIIQRDAKGTGAWTQTNFLGPAGIENDLTWPRIITSGEDNEYIHLISNSYVEYNGQTTALLYSRSSDGGASWDPQNIVLDGTGIDDYIEIGADDYMMAARGNTVCILMGSAWYDLFYLRSDDNGETWTKNLVWEHPYPFFDWNVTIADTFFCVDNSAHMTIDYEGHVHVVFGINRVMHLEVGTTYNLFPYVDGIGYWNDMMEPFSNDHNALAPPQYGYANSELEEDVNYIGYMQDVDGDGEITLNTD